MPLPHDKLTTALLSDDWAVAEALIVDGHQIDPENALPLHPETRAIFMAVQPPYYPNLARALVWGHPEAGKAQLGKSFRLGWTQDIKPLLEAGVKASFCGLDLSTKAMTLDDKLGVVDMLLEYGADPREDDSYFLCDVHQKRLFRRLVDAGASVQASLLKIARQWGRFQDFKTVFDNAWDEKLVTLAMIKEIEAIEREEKEFQDFVERKRQTLESMARISTDWCDQAMLASYQSATLEEVNAKFVACARNNDRRGLLAMGKLGADVGAFDNAALRNAVMHGADATLGVLVTDFRALDSQYNVNRRSIIMEVVQAMCDLSQPTAASSNPQEKLKAQFYTLGHILAHCDKDDRDHHLGAALHLAVVNHADQLATALLTMGANPFLSPGDTEYVIERRTDAPALQAALQARLGRLAKNETPSNAAQYDELPHGYVSAAPTRRPR